MVDAAAEAEVLVVLAIGVETLGVAEAGRVPAPGSDQQDHVRALWDRGTGNVDVGEGPPVGHHLDRWFIAQQLLDQMDAQLGIAPQPLEDVGVPQQCEHAMVIRFTVVS